jgi:hypothetical protein
MKAIIFSRDRPMQLDLLLTSLEQNAPGIFDPTVIWHAKRDDYMHGYEICAEEHPDARLLREDGLTYQVRSLMLGIEYVIFFTDDDVLYRPLGSHPLLYEGWICFSLRLGDNTTYCYPLSRHQDRPVSPQDQVVVWSWERGDGDFGYPMSLDGHIFRAQDLLPILHTHNFSNPNWLEETLMRGAKEIGRPLMACFHESHVVGIPANRVNTTTPNRNGETHPYPVQDLNQRYLRGERIDLDALDFSDIRSAHQEIPLVFR